MSPTPVFICVLLLVLVYGLSESLTLDFVPEVCIFVFHVQDFTLSMELDSGHSKVPHFLSFLGIASPKPLSCPPPLN